MLFNYKFKRTSVFVFIACLLCLQFTLNADSQEQQTNKADNVVIQNNDNQQSLEISEQKTEKTKKSQSIFSLKRLKDIFSGEKSKLYILIFAFLIGILSSFTPCIYPMIPITVGILQAQAAKSLWHNFLLSSAYVCGIAVVFASLGYLAATTTIIFGQWVSNPWLIAFIVLLFLYIAFSMFGFYEIHIPRFLKKRSGVKIKGSILYSFLFGVVSGSVASPCLTPALAILLSFVAKVGNPIFGFFALFAFALGMGSLLIVIGTFSSSASLLPRSGMWMMEVKKFFGFVLLAMAVYFLKPFISYDLVLKIYAVIALFASIYYFSTAKKNKIKIIFGLFLIFLSLFLLLSGVMKSSKLISFDSKISQILK